MTIFPKRQIVGPVKSTIHPTTLERSNIHHIKNPKERYELCSGNENWNVEQGTQKRGEKYELGKSPNYSSSTSECARSCTTRLILMCFSQGPPYY